MDSTASSFTEAFDQTRVNDLGILGQGCHQDADAEAAAEITHQAADRRPLGQDVERQRRQRDDVQGYLGTAEAETLQQPVAARAAGVSRINRCATNRHRPE
jgi:hypothetical protein